MMIDSVSRRGVFVDRGLDELAKGIEVLQGGFGRLKAASRAGTDADRSRSRRRGRHSFFGGIEELEIVMGRSVRFYESECRDGNLFQVSADAVFMVNERHRGRCKPFSVEFMKQLVESPFVSSVLSGMEHPDHSAKLSGFVTDFVRCEAFVFPSFFVEFLHLVFVRQELGVDR